MLLTVRTSPRVNSVKVEFIFSVKAWYFVTYQSKNLYGNSAVCDGRKVSNGTLHDLCYPLFSHVFSLFWTRKSSGDRQSSDHTLAKLVTQKSKSSFHSIWAVVEAHTDLECNCQDESNATVGHEDKYSPSRLRTYVTSERLDVPPSSWRTMWTGERWLASDALRFFDLDALRPEAVDSEVRWRYPVGIGWKNIGARFGMRGQRCYVSKRKWVCLPTTKSQRTCWLVSGFFQTAKVDVSGMSPLHVQLSGYSICHNM